MTPFAIAGIQMPLSAAVENVTAMGHRLDLLMLRYPWVQMVVFSELAAFGPLPGHAQSLPGPAEASFQAMALRHGIWLLPGSLYEKKDGRIYNTAPVIDPRGEVVARYRKMFPFRPYEEATTPGSEFVVFDVPGAGRFGVSICYDMWFPETTRSLAAMGAEVILHPTLTDTGCPPASAVAVLGCSHDNRSPSRRHRSSDPAHHRPHQGVGLHPPLQPR